VQVGVLGDVISNAENVVAKGRLGPGQMVCADLETGAARLALQQAQADLSAWSQLYLQQQQQQHGAATHRAGTLQLPQYS
jgi:hypothetical protein